MKIVNELMSQEADRFIERIRLVRDFQELEMVALESAAFMNSAKPQELQAALTRRLGELQRNTGGRK